jgi:hypothetical protein
MKHAKNWSDFQPKKPGTLDKVLSWALFLAIMAVIMGGEL